MTLFQLQCLIVGFLLMWLQRGALIQMRDFVTAMSVVFAILCLLILTGGATVSRFGTRPLSELSMTAVCGNGLFIGSSD